MVFDWSYFFSLFSLTDFWAASLTVVQLSIASWLISIVFGFVLALGRQSKYGILNAPAKFYIWLFRSLPLLVLLMFVYNMPLVFPASGEFLSDPFFAGLFAMVLCESAYIAEIHRGGLLSISKGQSEAAKALGIRFVGAQYLVIIPQAFRVALPALTNELVSIVKLTSLVSVVSLTEILLVGQRLYTQNFLVLETMGAVAIYYVMIVTVFDLLLRFLENALDVTKANPKKPLSQELIELISHTPPIKADKVVDIDGPALEAHKLHKSYNDVEVLGAVDLSVQTGDVVSIIGPSGSGKTTLIRLLNGLEQLDNGEINLNGNPFIKLVRKVSTKPYIFENAEHRTEVGMVFQSFNLFPHLSVMGNLLLAPKYHKLAPIKDLEMQAYQLLNKVGMLEHAFKYPHQLSGGQQQRIAIARALMMKPSIMLFDEPTSALDPEKVNEVLQVIEDLTKDGITMVIVTHEMNFAFKVSDRIVFMEKGRVVCDESPQALRRGDNPRVETFLKDVSLV